MMIQCSQDEHNIRNCSEYACCLQSEASSSGAKAEPGSNEPQSDTSSKTGEASQLKSKKKNVNFLNMN